jgi:hypothetical protein
MQVLDTKLKNFTNVTNCCNCPEVGNFTKKELTDKDCYYLRYCLMRFIENNQSNIHEFVDTENHKELYFIVDSEASICDNSLYIGNFEGYQISDNLLIKDLELSIESRVILNILDSEKDSYTSYLID